MHPDNARAQLQELVIDSNYIDNQIFDKTPMASINSQSFRP